MRHIARIARATAERHDLLPEGAPVLVMLSGGGDSVALLHLLASGALGERPVRALHVNHLLRGAESDADEAFAASVCEELDIECAVVRYDVAAYAAEEGLNLEDAGRTLRYRFAEEGLDAWCERLGAAPSSARIATAHTVDDRIETFFMRAVAGAGTGALSSIAAARGRIVRPLIDCEREELRTALAGAGIRWREDSSNADTRRRRALVRAELVPVLERLNPSYRTAMARTMDLLASDDALLSRLAEGFARDFAETAPDEVRFNRDRMRTLERTMARRTVREALFSAFPDAARLEAAHVEAVVDGFADDAFARDLPGGLRAECLCATLVVSRTETPAPRVAPALLDLPGHAPLGDAGEIVAEKADPARTDGDPDSVVVDVGTLADEVLVVDAAREGDRMRPLGMQGTKKLSDLLVDAKVPKRERGAVPVVRDGERIVWLAGVRMSDEYRVTQDTRRAVRLTWTRPARKTPDERE